MAISGGMIAVLLGAAGVGGYLVLKKRAEAAGNGDCEKMSAAAKAAAAAVGIPLPDSVAKFVCSVGGPGAVWDKASSIATQVNHALTGDPRAGCSKCPPNTTAPADGGNAGHAQVQALQAQYNPPRAVNGKTVCGFCLDGSGKIVALQLTDGQTFPWKPAATAPKSPLQLLGVTATLSSAGAGTNTRDGQKATSTSTSSGGVLVTSKPRK